MPTIRGVMKMADERGYAIEHEDDGSYTIRGVGGFRMANVRRLFNVIKWLEEHPSAVDPREQPTLEEKVRPQLLELFEKAGLEITLRTLANWVDDGFAQSDWWLHHNVLNLIGAASTLYGKRHLLDEEEKS